MESIDEIWDVDDVLENNTSVFVVKNIKEDRLLYALSSVYHYIHQFDIEDGKNYDILFYAEPSSKPKNQYFIFTNYPYDYFVQYNPEFLLEEKNNLII